MVQTKQLPTVEIYVDHVHAAPIPKKGSNQRHDIANVQINGIGLIPAVVALRAILESVRQEQSASEATYRWQIVVSPQTEELLKRMFGRTRGLVRPDVKYEAIQTIQKSFQTISLLEPPPDTVIQLAFAYTKQGNPELEWHASSTEIKKRQYQIAIRRNERVLAKWPGFGWLIKRFGWGLVQVPEQPGQDSWFQEVQTDLGRHIQIWLQGVLQSLWRAAFVMDASVAQQLQQHGYQLDEIGKTMIGERGLKDVMRSGRLGRLTMLG